MSVLSRVGVHSGLNVTVVGLGAVDAEAGLDCEHVLPRFLASFRAEYPEAEVSLEVGNRVRVWDLLDHREVDLAAARTAKASPWSAPPAKG